MEARVTIPLVALFSLLGGCGALSRANTKPALALEMRIVEDQKSQKARPYVILVGEGHLLASNQVRWALSGTLADGSPFFESKPKVLDWSLRYHNPYYLYQAWHRVPGESGFVGVVDAPLWVGPEVDTTFLRDVKSLNVHFTILYYSPHHSQVIIQTFDWPMVPYDPDRSIRSLD